MLEAEVKICNVSEYLYGTVPYGIHLHYERNQLLSDHAVWFLRVPCPAFQEMMKAGLPINYLVEARHCTRNTIL